MTETLPVLKGNATMARGASYFEVPLFSNIHGNLWNGCSPAEAFRHEGRWVYGVEFLTVEHEIKGYDEFSDSTIIEGIKKRPRFDVILNLYVWGQYSVPDGVEYMEAEMFDNTDELDKEMIDGLAKWVLDHLAAGKKVLVHCQAGLNRSSLVVARALMLGMGMSAENAIETIRRARSPVCLCNDHFADWLRSL